MRIEESDKLKHLAFSKLYDKSRTQTSNNITIIKKPSQKIKNKISPLNFSEKRNIKEENNLKDLKLMNRVICPKSAKIKRIKVKIIDDNCFINTYKREKEENIDLKIATQIEKISKIIEKLSGNVNNLDTNIHELKLVVDPIKENQKDNFNALSALQINLDENIDLDLIEENNLNEEQINL